MVVGPGLGATVGNVEFLAHSTDTPRFNLAIITIEPHSDGPDPHVHQNEDDAFNVLKRALLRTSIGCRGRARRRSHGRDERMIWQGTVALANCARRGAAIPRCDQIVEAKSSNAGAIRSCSCFDPRRVRSGLGGGCG